MTRRSFITNGKEELIISEQYRAIGTNIQFIAEEKEHNTILVTSPGQGEGKSVTVSNIAISLASQNQKKVLLIDANYKNPTLHKTFNIPDIYGFTDVLAGNIPFEEAVTVSHVEGLHILTSGTVPLSLLSNKLKQLMEKVKQSYDMVLIDAPPILEVSDTKIMAKICDGVVLIVRQYETSLESAMKSKKILDYARANVIGVVLNEKK